MRAIVHLALGVAVACSMAVLLHAAGAGDEGWVELIGEHGLDAWRTPTGGWLVAAESNGWLAEELPTKYREWLPPEVGEPRVKFENGVVLLAFSPAIAGQKRRSGRPRLESRTTSRTATG